MARYCVALTNGHIHVFSSKFKSIKVILSENRKRIIRLNRKQIDNSFKTIYMYVIWHKEAYM